MLLELVFVLDKNNVGTLFLIHNLNYLIHDTLRVYVVECYSIQQLTSETKQK